MIPKNIKMTDCVGRYATVDCDLGNGAGHRIVKGGKVLICGYGRTLDIKTDPCPCCGQYMYIRGIKKDKLTLLSEE